MKKYLPILFLLLSGHVMAQDSLTNKDVIDLTKAGVTEDIIIAKIKSSRCNFDTSSNSLIELKTSNVSDNVILAVLNCSKASSNTKPVTKNDNLYTIADAAGKRKVFIDSEDEQSELAIAKELRKRGFEVIRTRDVAELILEFKIDKTDQVAVGSIFSVYQTRVDREWGKLTVYLRNDLGENLIYAKNRLPSFVGKRLHKQATELVSTFAKELIKSENSKRPLNN